MICLNKKCIFGSEIYNYSVLNNRTAEFSGDDFVILTRTWKSMLTGPLQDNSIFERENIISSNHLWKREICREWRHKLLCLSTTAAAGIISHGRWPNLRAINKVKGQPRHSSKSRQRFDLHSDLCNFRSFSGREIKRGGTYISRSFLPTTTENISGSWMLPVPWSNWNFSVKERLMRNR